MTRRRPAKPPRDTVRLLLIAAILALAVAVAALPWSLPLAPDYVCEPHPSGAVVCRPMER